MQNGVQVKAWVPRELKRQAFVLFAAREEKFSQWLREQLALLVGQAETTFSEERARGETEGARARI